MNHVVHLSFGETLGGEPYWVPFAIIAELGQDQSIGVSGGICLQLEVCILVQLKEDWGQCDEVLSSSKVFFRSSVHHCTSPFFVSQWRCLVKCKKSWTKCQ